MVEAAGVEPASGSVTGEATPCSASSWFSPRRLEKRQNGGAATPNSFRRSVRGSGAATPAFRDVSRSAAGALSDKRGYLIRQPERSCCCSQLLFFTLFYEASEPRHATSRAIVPVEAVSPPRRDRSQRSGRDVNSAAQRVIPRKGDDRLTLPPSRNGMPPLE